jgi:lipid-A-disaccharide synthase-like uncharacterized protein
MSGLADYFKNIHYDLWLIVGFIGQFIFFLRFAVQWYYSEKAQASVIPVHFWYLSIAGALIVFVYAVVRKDPVFFLGQLVAIVIYLRNLFFIKKHKEKSSLNDANS